MKSYTSIEKLKKNCTISMTSCKINEHTTFNSYGREGDLEDLKNLEVVIKLPREKVCSMSNLVEEIET